MVIEVGEDVDLAKVGDLVAVPHGGTWSEQIVLPAEELLPLPPGLDVEQAAMPSVNPVTAAGLLEGLAPGDTVVQNAAASAVGRLVIRLAAVRGVRTVNVVRRAAQVAELEALGADVVLVGEEDLASRIAQATGGAPVARALDALAVSIRGYSRLRALRRLPPERVRALSWELAERVREGTLSSTVEARSPNEDVAQALAGC